MSLSSRTWMISAVTAAGVAGGAAIGAAHAPAASPPAGPTRAAADTQPQVLGPLQAQVRYLLDQERALRTDLAQARARLAAQLRAAARTVPAGQRPGAATPYPGRSAPSSTFTPSPAPAQAPATHATTGASGTTGTTSGDDSGEHDD